MTISEDLDDYITWLRLRELVSIYVDPLILQAYDASMIADLNEYPMLLLEQYT